MPSDDSLTCDGCGGEIDPVNHRVYLQPDGDHHDLCLECQTGVPNEKLYRPSTDGGQSASGTDRYCPTCDAYVRGSHRCTDRGLRGERLTESAVGVRSDDTGTDHSDGGDA